VRRVRIGEKMEKQDIDRLVQLRQFAIDQHNQLDGKGEPSAVIKQTDVANILTSVVKSIDDLLRPYVTFE